MDHAERSNGPPPARAEGESARGNVERATGEALASCGIAFMAKASVPGRAKTRLVPPLTPEEAAALNTAFLCDVADNVLLAASQRGERSAIRGFAAYGPPGSEDFFRGIMPAAIGLIAAWRPNFGECLWLTLREILASGHTSGVVLNADSPTLPTALLVETAELLALPGDRAVLGPSSDGGYYLLGVKTAHPRLFEDVAWSTERVAAQTMERAAELGLDVHVLPEWYDIDDADCLLRLHRELSGPRADHGREALVPHHAAQTQKLLATFWRDRDFRRRLEGVASRDAISA
jgi:rSAM/selenodomain-associated transferase 1